MEKIATYKSVVGFIKIGYENQKITFLKKVEGFIEGEKTDLTDNVFKQVEEFLSGKRKEFDFEYVLKGTPFQLKVWEALKKIPYGQTCSYKQIAEAVGNPKGSRAVGNANNKNPITLAVPCHRVVGASGKLVGYAGGLEMKTFLLNLEKENK